MLRFCNPTLRKTILHRRCSVRYASHNADVMEELSARGFVQAVTSPKLADTLKSKTTVYLGVDPSADSLHAGNLLPLLALLHFHIREHHVIALIGGATGMIGDPGGRSSERNLLSAEAVFVNTSSITHQVQRFLERGATYAQKRTSFTIGSTSKPKVLNNLDWFEGMDLINFLRTVGKHARVNAMLARESVKNRLTSESGISFTEFSYQLLQAYDFYMLRRDHGCTVQLGGSDQWGNIVAGIDVIRRLTHDESEHGDEDSAYGLTIPLLTTASGEKFGKSAGNAVWLSEEKTSVYDFYQFFLRVTDADVDRYLRLFTLLSTDEIAELMTRHQSTPEWRIAQRTLADEVTELIHGEESAKKAKSMTSLLFESVSENSSASAIVEALQGDARLVEVNSSDILGVPVSKVCAQFGLLPSRSIAQATQKAGGLYLNNARVENPALKLQASDLIDGRVAILRAGKGNHLILSVRGPQEEM